MHGNYTLGFHGNLIDVPYKLLNLPLHNLVLAKSDPFHHNASKIKLLIPSKLGDFIRPRAFLGLSTRLCYAFSVTRLRVASVRHVGGKLLRIKSKILFMAVILHVVKRNSSLYRKDNAPERSSSYCFRLESDGTGIGHVTCMISNVSGTPSRPTPRTYDITTLVHGNHLSRPFG